MTTPKINGQAVRRNFGKIQPVIDIPNLIEIQKNSFQDFLQKEVSPDRREDKGLQAVFKSVFPIKDFSETCSLDFVSYRLEEPKYDVDECLQRGMTYSAPFRITVRLVVFDVDEATGNRTIRDIKEQEVYFGEIPLMTENGTFIVNGTERVIVNQLHRSSGVFFERDKGKTHSSGKVLYSARVIPYRGSWLDFEFDHKDLLYVRIDRRRKIYATVLLKALGYEKEELLNHFYQVQRIRIEGEKITRTIDPTLLVGQRAIKNIMVPGTDRIILEKGKRFSRAVVARMKELGIETFPITREELYSHSVAHDVVHPKTGEILLECGEQLSPDSLDRCIEAGIDEFETLYIDNLNVSASLRDTLLADRIKTTEDAILEIYRRLRPGDPPTIETATTFFNNLFFNPERYDLSRVGRMKLNYKLGLDVPLEQGTLRREDILAVVRYLLELKGGRGEVDDIDHLGNRRVRSVGELLENQYRIGLVRMERAIKERLSLQDVDALMPHDLINAKPVQAVINEFLGSSQLSQFLDQTNPLSEVTHKRRLSALGPGGLTRERAGFEVRDVHSTHYGRICPIETPEGPNIGLIASLSTYARVNPHGFIETPYRVVQEGKVTNEVRFLSAMEEEQYVIVQANAKLDEENRLVDEFVSARVRGEFTLIEREKVQLMDVSPNQLVSVAASLIPFLEHDDANRALMGSNMQRQAVPLLQTEVPLVGTGMEAVVAADSGATVVARRDGVVESVDAERIVIKADERALQVHDPGIDIYPLKKYQRSNQNTCVNQKPIVQEGESVRAGQVIADGPATRNGELALGRNVLVAFMPWSGYNFEDSIVISERLLKNDSFTSVHIEEFECIARDTKLGKEEVSRDIPNVGEEALRNLDTSGIVRIGAEVSSGDILVGKVTPKGETQLSPEEKLLRAIFGEKAGDVRDTSLRVPPGISGTVIGVKIFSRKGVEKDERAMFLEEKEIEKLAKELEEQRRIIEEGAAKKIKALLVGRKVGSQLKDEKRHKILLKKGEEITDQLLEQIPRQKWREISVEGGAQVEAQVSEIFDHMAEQLETIRSTFKEKEERIKKEDELPPGVIKVVKVYLAIKRRLSVGDKMAGRHGNKGVVSKIVPEESMPYLEDGTPVDIILNPLGVPSRMNVGQILETHLGWAAHELGVQISTMVDGESVRSLLDRIYGGNGGDGEVQRGSFANGVPMASPVFDGASEEEIRQMLELAGLPSSGQTTLYDGRTGEPFHHKVTVGWMYMMKLHHLVDDKIHARSIGPYSLVTQQPLAGKAQFGGQRLGEMEVWAMEAYGAAYALQEFLTVKSDDVAGRTRMYEAIVKGKNVLEPGLPESFNVSIKELQSLCLNVELIEEDEELPGGEH